MVQPLSGLSRLIIFFFFLLETFFCLWLNTNGICLTGGIVHRENHKQPGVHTLSLPFVKIAGTGSYLPERVVSNDDLAKTLDTSDEWIYSHTGIRERHIAADSQSPLDMAYAASCLALQQADLPAEELGMIMLSTCTGDYNYFPSSACLLQHRLQAKNAAALDILAACSGFVYALDLARAWVSSSKKPALVVASEMLSRITDWQSRETCILFGDGAAAALLVPSAENGLIYSYLGADGEKAHLLALGGGCKDPIGREPQPPHYVEMQGRALFSVAVRAIEQTIVKILDENQLQIEQIAHVVPHQANIRILDAVAKRLQIAPEKLLSNIDKTANTSSASIPILLDELNRAGKLKRNDLILSVAFGGGLTYGGNLIRWLRD
ncbi:MAG: ketoacyl-ACP synthase III [Oligosphaeraceae bacterium]|nr:ketoacyl-ACP synthase III [Oligosphaeraceae bacterium]